MSKILSNNISRETLDVSEVKIDSVVKDEIVREDYKCPLCILSPEHQKDLIEMSIQAGRLMSPYRAYGSYWGIVEALSLMGENQQHLLGLVYKKFQEVMNDPKSKKMGETAWERYINKKNKNSDTGLDPFGKFYQNIKILQRRGGKYPYALKLSQVSACIDILVDDRDAPFIFLRTHIPAGEPVVPINQTRKKLPSHPLDDLFSLTVFRKSDSDILQVKWKQISV